MFDTTFASKPILTGNTQREELPFTYKKRIALLWEEHCLECAPPYCYNNCKLFLPREDGKCVRMRFGLRPTDEMFGSLNYGIDCTFRKWAKLEAQYTRSAVDDKTYNRYDNNNKLFSNIFIKIARFLKPFWPKLTPYGAYVAYRRKFIKGESIAPDTFYVKCILKNKEQSQLFIQMDAERVFFSKTYTLKKGVNEITVPLNHCLDSTERARIFLTPLNEETDTEIVFGWIDLFCGITYKNIEKPADKVKVLVWDLDNTLWDGTLVNGEVKIREEAVSLIKSLDKRGILNTISSKNDYEEAVNKLKEFGVFEYFVCPAINWGQKSINIQKIAKTLNLGINSFAFIDDNIREREEVKEALPMIRVYTDSDINKIVSLEEFNVQTSSESKNRRLSYQQEVSRQLFKEEFSDDYDSFLRSLGMSITIKKVAEETKERCYELLLRSNQLNLSTNRYNQEEYDALLSRPDVLCYAIGCKDKFGDYGIVSFISVKLSGQNADIVDFVISCRVAKKKVEDAIVRAVSKLLSNREVTKLNASLIKTKKNGPLAAVFDELPFKQVSADDKCILYSLSPLSELEGQDIIEVIFN